MSTKVCNTCGNTYLQKCGFCRALYKKDWRITFPERHRLYNDRKRAGFNELSAGQKQEIEEFYRICRARTLSTGVEHHVDHIIPLSKGGMHTPDNLQVLTAKENLMKSAKYNAEKITPDKSFVQLTDTDLLKICKTLAKRYRNQDQYEDLVSEGLLACYECREGGKNLKADYVGAARRAMNDYINIKSKAVSIPNSWTSRTVSRVMSNDEDLKKLDGVTGGTFMALMQAMGNDTETLTPNVAFTKDVAEDYEEREYNAHVMSVAVTTLDQDEWQVVRLRYYEELTQADVADLMQATQMWVSRTEKRALGKLREWLCNKS
jgi:RNA polymerase sigma factor (sigma-70 family)